MSQTDQQSDEHLFVCEYCGMRVYEIPRECPALENGRCEP